MTTDQMLYIVRGSTGEWSDRSDWMVRAYFTYDEAKSEVERLTTKLDELIGGRDVVSYEARKEVTELMREFDEDFSMDYTGTSWWIREVPLASALPCQTAADGASDEAHRRWSGSDIIRRIAFLDGVEWALQQPGVNLIRPSAAYRALYVAADQAARELGQPTDGDWSGLHPGDSISLKVRLHMIKDLHDAVAQAKEEHPNVES